MKLDRLKAESYALIAFSMMLFAGLTIFAYLGTFSRYFADDYCFTDTLFRSNNIIDATVQWYLGTSNRYTTMLLVGISEWFGRSAIRYLPALVIMLWLAALTWTLSRLTLRLRIPHSFLMGLAFALTIVFFSILQAPDRYQSLYWRSAMVTYFTPLILFSFLSGLILIETWREQSSRMRLVVIAIAIALGFFFAGGLSETTLAIQGGALGLAIMGTVLLVRGTQRKQALFILIPALIASVLALVVIFMAPANALRVRAFGPPPPLTEILLQSLIFAWDFIREAVKSQPLPTFAIFIIGVLSGFVLYREDTPFAKRSMLIASLGAIPFVVYILIFFSMAPSMYGQQTYTGARALMTSRAILVTGLLFVCFLLGLAVRMKTNRVVTNGKLFSQIQIGAILLLALSSVYPLYASNKIRMLVPSFRDHAIQWDQRDAFIRQQVAAGVKDVTVVQLDSFGGVLEYKADPISWVNVCAANYYGLDSLIAP